LICPAWETTGRNATTGLALRVTGTHKPLYHGKVKISIKGCITDKKILFSVIVNEYFIIK
jgi:hypothetical protein